MLLKENSLKEYASLLIEQGYNQEYIIDTLVSKGCSREEAERIYADPRTQDLSVSDTPISYSTLILGIVLIVGGILASIASSNKIYIGAIISGVVLLGKIYADKR